MIFSYTQFSQWIKGEYNSPSDFHQSYIQRIERNISLFAAAIFFRNFRTGRSSVWELLAIKGRRRRRPLLSWRADLAVRKCPAQRVILHFGIKHNTYGTSYVVVFCQLAMQHVIYFQKNLYTICYIQRNIIC